jgi:UDP-N-acetylmuramate dehydrogenase
MRTMDHEGVPKSAEKKTGDFGYRQSPVGPSECVLSARFLLKERPKAEILARMEHVYGERKKRHPMERPSSGSIFKSVNGEPAWKFIEEAGLKGLRVGGAEVSEKHANFIVNLGSAKAADIKMLIDRVKKAVFEKSGVSLKEEVEIWGFDA